MLRRSVLVVVMMLAGLAWWLWPPGVPRPRSSAFTLEGVTVIQPGESRREAATVHVAGGAIVDAAAAGAADAFPELRGSFVLPGIVDMHTHLPADTPLRLTQLFGILYALHGVTSVRDAGDIDGTAVAAAHRVYDTDGAVGPRVFSCGPFVGGGQARWKNTITVNDPSEAPALARRLKEEGRVCMKIYDGLDAARVRALAAAARAEGLTPIGHVPFGLVMETAGVPEIQHLMGTARPEDIAGGDHVVHRVDDWRGVDDARIAAMVEASRTLGIAHTPTLVTNEQLLLFLDYENGRRSAVAQLMPRLFRDVVWNPTEGLAPYRSFGPKDVPMVEDAITKKLRAVRGLDAAGVPLYVGTDTSQPFVVPGVAAQQEMRLFARAGIPLDHVWRDATTAATATLPVAALGRLVAGAPADFLVFAADPTADIEALASLRAVVLRGRLYFREDLEAALRRQLAWYANPLLDWVAVSKARAILAASVTSNH